MKDLHETRRIAELAVSQLSDEQAERLAALPIEHIPLALRDEEADRLPPDRVVEIQREVSRCCRERMGLGDEEAA